MNESNLACGWVMAYVYIKEYLVIHRGLIISVTQVAFVSYICETHSYAEQVSHSHSYAERVAHSHSYAEHAYDVCDTNATSTLETEQFSHMWETTCNLSFTYEFLSYSEHVAHFHSYAQHIHNMCDTNATSTYETEHVFLIREKISFWHMSCSHTRNMSLILIHEHVSHMCGTNSTWTYETDISFSYERK